MSQKFEAVVGSPPVAQELVSGGPTLEAGPQPSAPVAGPAKYDLTVLAVEQLVPNDEQARQAERDQGAFLDLVESVRRHGVKQPLLVRPLGDGRYRVVDGHGRLAAAKAAGLTALPCLVEHAIGRESEELRLQYHTNQLREGLRPLDQARLFKRLMKSDGMTQQQVAAFLGVSQSYVSDCLQALKAPSDVRARVDEGTLSAKRAVALVRDLKKKAEQPGADAEQPSPAEAPKRGKSAKPKPELHSYAEFELRDETTGLSVVVLGPKTKSPPRENVILTLRRMLSLLELQAKHDA